MLLTITLLFKTKHSQHALQKSLPPKAVKFSPGNSRALCDGVMLLGSCFPSAVDCSFPRGGGFKSIFNFLAKSEGCGAHTL